MIVDQEDVGGLFEAPENIYIEINGKQVQYVNFKSFKRRCHIHFTIQALFTILLVVLTTIFL